MKEQDGTTVSDNPFGAIPGQSWQNEYRILHVTGLPTLLSVGNRTPLLVTGKWPFVFEPRREDVTFAIPPLTALEIDITSTLRR